MKKYKLVKTYPGSPALDTISSPKDKQDGMHYFTGIWFDPSAYPDYWEKVIEKDYEVLSLISKQFPNSSVIISKRENGLFLYGEGKGLYPLEYYKDIPFIQIHSVKRLSDGEIFTIGDKVQYFVCRNWDDLSISKITKFIIDKDYKDSKIVIFTDQNETPWAHLSENVRKTLEPLFTTEDGVDIFEGDIVWHTNLNFDKPYSSPVKKADKPYTPVKGLYSSYEKAEEYIIMNKPCLSVNDILNTALTFQSSDKRRLETLVKNKLNK